MTYRSFSDWEVEVNGSSHLYELFALTLHHGINMKDGHCTNFFDCIIYITRYRHGQKSW